VNELRARLDTPLGREWVRRAAWVVLLAAFLAFLVRGANGPQDPSVSVGNRIPLQGFDDVAFRVTGAKGAMSEWCAMLADTNAKREQGLMGQRDLRGYDAMVFRYDSPVKVSFWMKDTLIPLSLAYFGADGHLVSSVDMAPCPPNATSCPSYPPTSAFLDALEVPAGGLARLGIAPASTLSLTGRRCRS
jgi:uncharacterized membrane protein (UPF0127 family)